MSETIVQAALFFLALSFVNGDLDTSQFSGAEPDRSLLVGIGVALFGSAVLVMAVPKLRNGSCRKVRGALLGHWSVARIRGKRVELFGGTSPPSFSMRSPSARRASRTASNSLAAMRGQPSLPRKSQSSEAWRPFKGGQVPAL